MFISLVIPVYNRPQEVRELLESLTHQTRRDFETVVVEDGSAPELSSDGVVREYADRLDICYVRQPNGGPAAARNTGAAHAHGDFLVIMDSDCIVPPGYFETVYAEVEARGIAFYGGPDMAAPDFSPLQKAVSYSMTSVFTTGGIRGNRRSIGKFSPRSFNLGISRPLFEQVGGFSDMRIGEDIDFSMRVMAAGAQAWFLPDAKVCHKRRTSIRLFFKQVFVFGTARVNLDIRHPESRRALFMLRRHCRLPRYARAPGSCSPLSEWRPFGLSALPFSGAACCWSSLVPSMRPGGSAFLSGRSCCCGSRTPRCVTGALR